MWLSKDAEFEADFESVEKGIKKYFRKVRGPRTFKS